MPHVVGIWIQATEEANFWAGICAELANRGVKGVLILCCDRLNGFSKVIGSTPTMAVFDENVQALETDHTNLVA